MGLTSSIVRQTFLPFNSSPIKIQMFVTTLLTLLIATTSASHGGCDTSSHSFDYMLHVQQWPASFGKPVTTYTTMHGMWPSRTGSDESSYPCTCTTETFDPSKFPAALSADMSKYWLSLEGPNTPFWTHEWTKHGTCADLPTQAGFFNTTLAWRKLIDAVTVLKDAGITPGDKYEATKIDAAFTSAIGVTALLGCGKGGDNSVQTFSFCIDHDAQKLVECDASVKSGAGGVVSCDRSQDILFSDGSSPGPSPGPSPTPSGDQCVPSAHGPKCSTDSDCTSYPHCVRCAHTGYCTESPATKNVTASFMR